MAEKETRAERVLKEDLNADKVVGANRVGIEKDSINTGKHEVVQKTPTDADPSVGFNVYGGKDWGNQTTITGAEPLSIYDANGPGTKTEVLVKPNEDFVGESDNPKKPRFDVLDDPETKKRVEIRDGMAVIPKDNGASRPGGNNLGKGKETGGGEKTGSSHGPSKGEPGDSDGEGNITSPEGVLMLCVAGIIDVISLIPVINIISDILGIIIIGGWLVITRPGEALKKATKRFLIACGIELIPIVSIAPSWTWFVYKTLNDG